MNSIKTARVGIVGLGAFGRLVAESLNPYFRVICHDLVATPISGIVSMPLRECAGADIVILAVPLSSLESVVIEISDWIMPGAVVVDVCSVKSSPANILMKHLPIYVDILCTHPLFGPQSAASGLSGLSIVLCPIRVRRLGIVQKFLEKVLTLQTILANPAEHDRQMAMIQGLTHFITK